MHNHIDDWTCDVYCPVYFLDLNTAADIVDAATADIVDAATVNVDYFHDGRTRHNDQRSGFYNHDPIPVDAYVLVRRIDFDNLCRADATDVGEFVNVARILTANAVIPGHVAGDR